MHADVVLDGYRHADERGQFGICSPLMGSTASIYFLSPLQGPHAIYLEKCIECFIQLFGGRDRELNNGKRSRFAARNPTSRQFNIAGNVSIHLVVR